MDIDPALPALLADLRALVVRSGDASLLARLTAAEQTLVHPEFKRLLDELDRPGTNHIRRAWIGDRLDLLGDRRPGVTCVAGSMALQAGTSDPPTNEALQPGEVRFWGDRPEHAGLPDIVWVAVPGAHCYHPVTDEGGLGDFDMAPFYLAKYPVTNVQFQAFLKAPDGFTDERWWASLAADDFHRQRPGWPRLGQANHPREAVSWYDAVAFCQWLNARLGWPLIPAQLDGETLAQGGGVRLPTEWERQWAAEAGDPARRFPWGEVWEPAHANTRESGLARTTAVGLYPAGAARCGARDLCGNVREWCLTEADWPTPIDLASEGERVVRGGSWNGTLTEAQTHYRFRFKPHFRQDFVGFRLVCRRPAG